MNKQYLWLWLVLLVSACVDDDYWNTDYQMTWQCDPGCRSLRIQGADTMRIRDYPDSAEGGTVTFWRDGHQLASPVRLQDIVENDNGWSLTEIFFVDGWVDVCGDFYSTSRWALLVGHTVDEPRPWSGTSVVECHDATDGWISTYRATLVRP